MKPETRKQEVERVENRLKAVKARVKGKSFEDIGEELGVSTTTAHDYVKHYFGVVAKLTEELAGEAKAIDRRRLDDWLVAINKRIEVAAEDPEADLSKLVTAGIKILERRARLDGLDAPAKVETSSADTNNLTEEQLWQRINQLAEKRKQEAH